MKKVKIVKLKPAKNCRWFPNEKCPLPIEECTPCLLAKIVTLLREEKRK